jgi:hypothetical protein
MTDSAKTCAFCHGQFWDRPGVTEEAVVWLGEQSRPVTYWLCDDLCRQKWLAALNDGEPRG